VPDRSGDWLRQAERDLAQAESSRREGRHEWACFAVPAELIEAARVLDNYYIPSRYPNSHPEGAPFEHYGPLQSDGALEHARQIVEFARSKMAEGR